MKDNPQKIRIDKWLWAVRLYKTRTLAAEACTKGRVSINNQEVKPGRILKEGDIIKIHRGPWHQQVKVIALLENRVAASAVKDFMEDISSPEELERLKLHRAALASWKIDGGSGRPTKKDRRDMEEFLGDF